ncbi:hypothetical protein ACR9E3_12505 [Actinomycetospora sp. C-140]
MPGVLLAVAVGAGLALWLILAAFPVGARGEGRDGGTAPAEPAPAAVETVGPATVVATSSCVGEDPRDTVAVDGPAGRRLMPLDACGTTVGSRITVRMAFVGAEPADTPARVLGTGSSAALAATEPAESPLTGRLEILLTGVAGLGMAGLLVAIARERSRRAASTARRPARPVTTTTTRGPEPRPRAGTAHRPTARPGRSARAGRPAALDAGRRLPGSRESAAGRGAARSRSRGHGAGPRRPAAGPHRG